MTTPLRRAGMPSLGGTTAWLNSEPLNPAGLHGSVVLVDFWTLTCINWLRTEPYVRAWSQTYRDDGLVVIGVHTPEFSFEHDIDLVRQAVANRAIDYPVAVDNDYSVWSAFDNHYWPALYFVDRDGIIRDTHFGEGRYGASERLLHRLLGIDREPVSVAGVGVEAEADWDHLRTPETYLGFERSENFSSPGGAALGKARTYDPPEHLPVNHWALSGHWTVGPECVVSEGEGTIAYRFHARDAHLVLSSGAQEPIPFRVLLDGDAPGRSRGEDVDREGWGTLLQGRLYQLVRQGDAVRERTVTVSFPRRSSGVRVHVRLVEMAVNLLHISPTAGDTRGLGLTFQVDQVLTRRRLEYPACPKVRVRYRRIRLRKAVRRFPISVVCIPRDSARRPNAAVGRARTACWFGPAVLGAL